MSKDTEVQETRFKFGPEHHHFPQVPCPVTSCTWPLAWEIVPALGPQVVLPMRAALLKAAEAWAAQIREAGFSRALEQIRTDPSVIRPTPAPQPADLFKRDPEAPVDPGHPKPLVPLRDALEVEILSPARTLRKLAESHGWSVRATYALGWVLDARGRVGTLRHSVCLRMTCGQEMHPGTRMVVAQWVCSEADPETGVKIVPTKGWKFDLAYGWGAGQPHHKLSAAALKETIKEA